MQVPCHDVRAWLLTGAFSENTIKSHDNQMRQYTRFCSALQIEVRDEWSLARWVMHSAEVLHLRKNTLLAKIEAFKWTHANVWGLGPVNMAHGSTVRLLIRCVQRMADDRQPKLPIGAAELQAVLTRAEARMATLEFKQLRAWCVLSYAGFLRCSEAAALCWRDVAFEADSTGVVSHVTVRLTVHGRHIFKNHSESILLRLQRYGQGSRLLCPVRCLSSWRQVSTETARVFTVQSDYARQQLQIVASRALGNSQQQFGLHSLRAGAATDAEKQGQCLSEIMFQGRWKSATVLQYMRSGERMAAQLGVSVRRTRDTRCMEARA